MRQARLRAPNADETAYYHCISRVVNREFVLGDEERDEFVKLLRGYERFCGVQVLTFCVMSNHFHILVGVPPRPTQKPSDAQLLARVKPVFSPAQYADLAWRLDHFRKQGADDAAEELRESILRRMWDVSAFMKGLKQRFSGWFNRRHRRRGTLWEERFKSVLVEAGDALVTMAAYIDLNPLRAGMVGDPLAYRWCGYHQAIIGNRLAKAGLKKVMHAWSRTPMSGNDALEAYRELLFGAGEKRNAGTQGEPGRRGFDPARVQAVLATGGKLDRWELLRCRVRHFIDGAVLDSKQFVEQVFKAERPRFSPRRRKGPKPIVHDVSNTLHTLHTLRDVQKAAITTPPIRGK